MKRFAAAASIIAMLVFMCALPDAYARGRVVIGGGVIVGEPYHPYPPYYGYPYYAYPPTYYPPPEPIYPPPPPTPMDQYYNGPGNRYCREYHRTVIINGQRQEAYGHACRQPDGTWQIID